MEDVILLGGMEGRHCWLSIIDYSQPEILRRRSKRVEVDRGSMDVDVIRKRVTIWRFDRTTSNHVVAHWYKIQHFHLISLNFVWFKLPLFHSISFDSIIQIVLLQHSTFFDWDWIPSTQWIKELLIPFKGNLLQALRQTCQWVATSSAKKNLLAHVLIMP
jgi:hypothetical protein